MSGHQKCCSNDLVFCFGKNFFSTNQKKLAYSGKEQYLSGNIGQSGIKEQG